MSRVEFMEQLERLLWDIPESDRVDAITYYNNYFDEAGAENEERVLQELGTPEKVAATIKTDLNSGGNECGEYTEHGYSYARYDKNWDAPIKKEEKPRQKKNIPWVLIIILLVLASPIIFGVGAGLLGGLIGLIAGAFGIIIAIAGCAIGFSVAGVVCFVVDIFRVFLNLPEGLVTMGMERFLLH